MFKEGHCCGCDKRVPGIVNVAITGVYIHQRLLCNDCNQEWEKFITTKLRKDLLQIVRTGEQQFMYFLGRRWAEVKRVRTVRFAPRSKISKYKSELNKILAAIAKVSGNKETIHALITDESTVSDFFEINFSQDSFNTFDATLNNGMTIGQCQSKLSKILTKLSKILKVKCHHTDYLVTVAWRMKNARRE